MSDDPRAAVPSAARRMLRPAHLKAIERTEEQLRALDDACRLLVQDARDMKEPLTSRPQFEVRCARSAEFDEVRDLVLASLRERGDFRDGDKEPVMVLNGMTVAELLAVRPPAPAVKWSAPYVGVLWLLGSHVEPVFVSGARAVRW